MTARLLIHAPFTLLFSVSVLLPGCSNTKDASLPSEQQSNQQTNSQETEAERCRTKLASAIVRVAPAALAIQERPERAINGLNAWIAACAADEVDELELSEATIALIGDSARATSRRFTVNDAGFISDCLLLRDLGNSLFARLEDANGAATSDVDRVQATFDWLTRNVSLLNKDESRVPLGLSDVLMTGRGTVEDRAWLFAETLRQQQIDAVVVRTTAAPEEGDGLASLTWLVAVLLEKNSVLFNPQTGMPVEAKLDDQDVNVESADLDALKNHERWKISTVEVVAQLPAFSPRMLVLQEQLAADDAAILYEELTGGTSEILPLVTRVLTAGGDLWTKEKVTVWEYPESQVVAANALTEQQQQEFNQIMRPFEGPFQRKPYQSESLEELTTVPEALKPQERQELVQQRLLQDYSKILESSEDMFGKPSRQLLKTRLQQILGNSDTSVIQQLQQVRISSMEESTSIRIPDLIRQRDGLPEVIKIPFPNMILEVNQSTTGDSLYWTAMCQMDRGEYGAAITTLMNYRRQYPAGKWKYPSLIHHGLCLIQQKRVEDAVSILEEANQDENPEQQRVQKLIESLK